MRKMKKHYNDPRFEKFSYDLDDVLTSSPLQWGDGTDEDGGELDGDDIFG